MQYLNADNIENITPSEVNALDRHAITLDNSITYEENESKIFSKYNQNRNSKTRCRNRKDSKN